MKRLMLFAALLAWSAMASAVVYKWTDAQGKVQYGDRPPDGVHAEIVEGLGGTSHNSAAPARSASANSSSSSASAPPTASNAQRDSADKKAIDQDVAATRDKQCADAQANYKKLIEGRRLFKTGADGERQYLTSDQIDNERLNAKRDLDSICNSTT
jgi:uncharacterized protein DUF4124